MAIGTFGAFCRGLELDEERRAAMIKEGTDLALLAQNLLQGEALTDFVERSFQKLHEA